MNRCLAFAFSFGALAGCNNPTYLSERRPLETQPPMMMGQNGYQSDTDLFVLPVRRPTATERAALTAEQMKKGLPMAVPWAATRDFDIEIEYTLKNLDAQPVQAFLTLTGGNEFGDYNPMLYIDPKAPPAEQTPPPPLMGGTPLSLLANEIKSGVFREDEIYEAGLDLEAITRYPDPTAVRSTPFRVIEHNSTASMIGREAVPPNDVTPAMVRFRFLLASDGHVALDYGIRVRDHNGKLASPTDPNLYVPAAATLAPPVMPPATMMAAP